MPSGTASVSKKSVSSSKTSKKDASQTEAVAEVSPTPAPAVEAPAPVETPAETANDASEVSPLQAETLALL